MEKEKYVKLFKSIVGRELTPQEFLAAKSDFDPKQIKAIAGLATETASESVAEDHQQVSDAPVEALSEKENDAQPTTEKPENQVPQASQTQTKKKSAD